MMKRVLMLALLSTPPLVRGSPAQPPESAAPRPDRALDELTLEELLDMKTSVATRSERSLREVPGIVTVVTREEILSSGARDLIDVLQAVPGFHLGIDAENMVGIGVRGVWGQEGKVLLLLDGQQMNEPYYDCLGLGNHYPVDQFERIEIIRGPGSVTYGGLAELAVVNLVTREAEAIGGAYLRGSYGQMRDGWGRRTLSAQLGQTFLEDRLRVAVSGYLGQGRRSDRKFVDFGGSTFPMADGSRLDPALLNASLHWSGLSLRLILDGYSVGVRDGMGEVGPSASASMAGSWVEAAWKLAATPNLTLTPTLQFRRQYPWMVTDPDSPMYFHKVGDHWQVGVRAAWKPAASVEVLAGAEAAWKHARVLGPTLSQGLLQGDRRSADYQTGAAYLELLYGGAPANLSLGARHELHGEVRGSFVPRAALTRAFGPAHVKLLYAQAFRTPGFGNLALSEGIRPERTEVAEAEVGYRFGSWLFASLNAFDVTVHRPIVYFSDVTMESEGYRNGTRTGSRGLEVEARAVLQDTSWKVGYSFYSVAGKNQVSDYAVPGHATLARAFPRHKVTLSGRFHAGPLRLGPTAIVTSDRYAEVRGDAAGEPVVGNAGPLVLLDFEASWRNLGQQGLELSAGVHNLLDARSDFLHPYPGHAPLPGPSREVTVSLTWQSPPP